MRKVGTGLHPLQKAEPIVMSAAQMTSQKHAARVTCAWPERVHDKDPSDKDQIFAVLSPELEASSLPSGLNKKHDELT
jgi:hypothetical protein